MTLMTSEPDFKVTTLFEVEYLKKACSGGQAPVSEMTYTVSSGMLNSSIPYHSRDKITIVH